MSGMWGGLRGMWGRDMKTRRWRRMLKWAGLLLCVVLAITLWISHSYRMGVFVRDRWIFVENGDIRMVVYIHGVKRPFSKCFLEPLGEYAGWHSEIESNPPTGVNPWITRHSKEPIWFFLLVACAATGLVCWLNWRGRPSPPGHCKSCGYDLTGNVSGVCSECGVAVPESGG